MKQVFSSMDSGQVAFIRSVLEAAKIPFEVRNEEISQTMPMPIAPEVWVQDEDFEDASRLIAESQAPS